MRLALGFALGALVVSTLAYAQNVEVHCRPVLLPRCENALKMYFERGYIPNRCKVT